MADVVGHPGEFFHLSFCFHLIICFLGCKPAMTMICHCCKPQTWMMDIGATGKKSLCLFFSFSLTPPLIFFCSGSISNLSFSVQVCRRTPYATIHRKKEVGLVPAMLQRWPSQPSRFSCLVYQCDNHQSHLDYNLKCSGVGFNHVQDLCCIPGGQG